MGESDQKDDSLVGAGLGLFGLRPIPFVDRIRAELGEEVEAENRDEIEKMKAEYESQIAEMQQDLNGRMVAQLRERLLAMAGYQSESAPEGKEAE